MTNPRLLSYRLAWLLLVIVGLWAALTFSVGGDLAVRFGNFGVVRDLSWVRRAMVLAYPIAPWGFLTVLGALWWGRPQPSRAPRILWVSLCVAIFALVAVACTMVNNASGM